MDILNLKNEMCSVAITDDKILNYGHYDTDRFDFVYDPDNFAEEEFYSVFAIRIESHGKKFDIALIGSLFACLSDSSFLDGNVLTVMQNKTISQICVDDGKLIMHKEFDCYGDNFGIYRVKGGYFVHGEMSVLMLDQNFDPIWEHGSRDIFVSINRENAFELCENSIKVYDFEDNFYEFDYDGNIINDIPHA